VYKKVFEEAMNEGAPLPFELPAWNVSAPFEEYLGIRIEEAADGRALLTMPFKVKLAQGQGLMHGGAVAALADTAVAVAIKSVLREESNFVTTDLSLSFHAPVRGGTVRAKALVERRDERTFVGTAELFDEKGIKIATFHSTFKVVRRR
jgi:acyl-CoA thioesterase